MLFLPSRRVSLADPCGPERWAGPPKASASGARGGSALARDIGARHPGIHSRAPAPAGVQPSQCGRRKTRPAAAETPLPSRAPLQVHAPFAADAAHRHAQGPDAVAVAGATVPDSRLPSGFRVAGRRCASPSARVGARRDRLAMSFTASCESDSIPWPGLQVERASGMKVAYASRAGSWARTHWHWPADPAARAGNGQGRRSEPPPWRTCAGPTIRLGTGFIMIPQ